MNNNRYNPPYATARLGWVLTAWTGIMIGFGLLPACSSTPAVEREGSRRTVSSTANLTESDTEQPALLVEAAVLGDIEAARRLLAAGTPVDTIDKPTGMTALHIAATLDDVQMLHLLLASGADPNLRDARHSFTAVQHAVRSASNQAIPVLLAIDKAKTQPASESEPTLYALAVSRDLPETLALLLKNQERIGRIPNDLLHHAVAWDKPRTVETLLENGSDINARRADDQATPVLVAVATQREQMIVRLLKSRADLAATNNRGVSPLHAACALADVQTVRMLLKHKAPVNAADKAGYTPLHMAALAGSAEVADLLIQAGADKAAQSKAGLTASAIANENGNRRLANQLAP